MSNLAPIPSNLEVAKALTAVAKSYLRRYQLQVEDIPGGHTTAIATCNTVANMYTDIILALEMAIEGAQ